MLDRVRAATHSGTPFAFAWLLAYGMLVPAWWAMLAAWPESRTWFHPPGAEWLDLAAFALPDLALATPLCLLAAVALARQHPARHALAWAAAGVIAAQAAYVVAWAVLREGGWLGVATMVPAAALATLAALDMGAGVMPIFRRARPRSAAGHVLATAVWVVVFWGFFLGVLPLVILFLEGQLGIPSLEFAGQVVAGVLLFLLASALGLWSGWTMARLGGGTPMPLDGTTRLVVSGPYSSIRNPMVVAGLTQGLAVGIAIGSWGTLLYVLAGGLVWNFIVRPAEERDLRQLFGPPYEEYCEQVRCWTPRRAGAGAAQRGPWKK